MSRSSVAGEPNSSFLTLENLICGSSIVLVVKESYARSMITSFYVGSMITKKLVKRH